MDGNYIDQNQNCRIFDAVGDNELDNDSAFDYVNRNHKSLGNLN